MNSLKKLARLFRESYSAGSRMCNLNLPLLDMI